MESPSDGLLDRCLAGDCAAWDELAAQFGPHIHQQAQIILDRVGIVDRNLADDLSQKVWVRLLERPNILRRFDCRRAGVRTYLARVVWQESRVSQRSEMRLKAREHLVRRSAVSAPDQWRDWSQFLGSLSDAERVFFERSLVGGEDGGYSAQNVWQLRHRVRKKLLAFLREE